MTNQIATLERALKAEEARSEQVIRTYGERAPLQFPQRSFDCTRCGHIAPSTACSIVSGAVVAVVHVVGALNPGRLRDRIVSALGSCGTNEYS